MPSEFTAASRAHLDLAEPVDPVDPADPAAPGPSSGQGSVQPPAAGSRASPEAMRGCGRAPPGPGGIVPAAIATAVLIRLAMPAAARA